ncbi:MAG: methylated-DNA--[protein]-cysteine S-methyltransferase [Corynebacteriales bacterium]|nr:methylated-DNA--[protein]-cysteine S-methyltransferase [Mycobacteriales bacterium]
MTASSATITTPIGPFTVISADDAVLASGWTGDTERLRALIHPSLRPTELRQRTELGAITRAVEAYHQGELTAIDGITVTQRSGEFREHAWDVLRKVPAGELTTYAQFAALAGRPAAIRAAAGACAYNGAALFVPCHRIVRTGSTPEKPILGGFAYGLDAKSWLLAHEAKA